MIFGYARRGVNPSIYAAATILILTVSVGIIAYSITTIRAQPVVSATRRYSGAC